MLKILMFNENKNLILSNVTINIVESAITEFNQFVNYPDWMRNRSLYHVADLISVDLSGSGCSQVSLYAYVNNITIKEVRV